MKKIIRTAALCLLLLVLPVAAFAEKGELPLEYVTYGYGMPDPASVPAHELSDQNVTLEGILYETKHENGRVYIRLGDLAAAKLLRKSEAKAMELGLDYEKLMIAQGRPMPRQDLTEQEQAEVQEKLRELTASARVGVTTEDIFTLANAGEEKLQVRIAGFVAAPEEIAETEPEKTTKPTETPETPETPDTPETPETPQEQVNVEAKGSDSSESLVEEIPERRTVTTIYVYYFGETTYSYPNVSHTVNEQKEYLKYQEYTLVVGIAYSQEDLESGVQYYLTLDSGEEDVIFDPQETDLMNHATKEAPDIAGKTLDDSGVAGKVLGAYQWNESEKVLPTIRVSRDKAGNDIVKTIHMVDKTPEAEDVLDLESPGDFLKPGGPEGYTPDSQNTADHSVFIPDEMTTVELDPNDPSDVTIEVRDVLDVDAWDPTKPQTAEDGEPVVMEQPVEEQPVEEQPVEELLPQAEPEASAAE